MNPDTDARTGEPRTQRLAIYAGALYQVGDGPRRVTIRIGAKTPALDAIVARARAAAWTFVTAYNPGDARPPREVNVARQSALLSLVVARGFGFAAAVASAPDGAHREPSILVVLTGSSAPRADARALGRRFRQAAIVYGVLAGAAELVPLDP